MVVMKFRQSRIQLRAEGGDLYLEHLEDVVMGFL